MLLVKVVLNTMMLMINTELMIIYLNTPLEMPEYFKLKLTNIPQEVITEYQLCSKAMDENFVYIEINKGIYGLLQAGRLT